MLFSCVVRTPILSGLEHKTRAHKELLPYWINLQILGSTYIIRYSFYPFFLNSVIFFSIPFLQFLVDLLNVVWALWSILKLAAYKNWFCDNFKPLRDFLSVVFWQHCIVSLFLSRSLHPCQISLLVILFNHDITSPHTVLPRLLFGSYITLWSVIFRTFFHFSQKLDCEIDSKITQTKVHLYSYRWKQFS